jgi:hypothetical protein
MEVTEVNTGATAGTVTAAVFLAGITAVLMWKKASVKWVSWLALATGLTGASVVLSWLGTLATVQVYGAGIVGLTLVIGGIILWHEMVKGKRPHRIRTPLIAFFWAVALMSAGGAAGNAAHGVSHGITTTVDRGTTAVTGRGPGG